MFCYGQTGAGKTYTINGGTDFSTRGLIPRVIENLDRYFIDNKSGVCIELSYLELYNERFFDLLCNSKIRDSNLKILENTNGEIQVSNRTWVKVDSVQNALDIFFQGQEFRSVAGNGINSTSNRSHTIFSIRKK